MRKRGRCCLEFLSRIPYGSLTAFGLWWVGAVLFYRSVHAASAATLETTARLLADVSQPASTVRISFAAVGILMCVVSLLFLISGVLSSGATRAQVYTSSAGKLWGQVSCCIFIILAYVLKIFWLLTFLICCLFSLAYFAFFKSCESMSLVQEEDCFSLKLHFKVDICGTHLQYFCSMTESTMLDYCKASLGSLLVILSLVHFLICLGANHAHIQDMKGFSVPTDQGKERNFSR